MKDYNGNELKVGDLVRIRPYQKMAEEFGTDKDGNISAELVRHRFMYEFKKYCGKKCIISDIFVWADCEFVRSKTVLTEHGFMCNLPEIALEKINNKQ